MKTKLKILYKTPDLEALAEKHQDFDGLMDSMLDEKIRRRKKLYRFSSFAIVIVSTAFLSWLYWGYEPTSSQPEATPQQEATTPVVEEEEKKPEEAETLEEEVQMPNPIQENPPAEVPREAQVAETKTETEEVSEKPKTEEDELALPSVTITRTERVSARPLQGLEDLYIYLYSKVDLPDSMLGESGSFFLEVSFMVKENGDISNVVFSKELPEEVESQMRETFLNMPEWEPAKQGDDAVDSDVKLPITFQKKD